MLVGKRRATTQRQQQTRRKRKKVGQRGKAAEPSQMTAAWITGKETRMGQQQEQEDQGRER